VDNAKTVVWRVQQNERVRQRVDRGHTRNVRSNRIRCVHFVGNIRSGSDVPLLDESKYRRTVNVNIVVNVSKKTKILVQ